MRARRRDVLLGATTLAAAGSLPAPAIAQNVKEFRLVSAYPKDLPGSATSPERLAQSIAAMSDGHLKVTVYPADTLVRALEVFDAVSASAADMYFTDEKYFQDKSPALNFFSTVPYGLTTDEFRAWILFGGGQALWDQVDAQFNINPLMLQSTGVQWTDGSSRRSRFQTISRDCAIGCRNSAPRSCAAWALRSCSSRPATLPARSNPAPSMAPSSGSSSTKQPTII